MKTVIMDNNKNSHKDKRKLEKIVMITKTKLAWRRKKKKRKAEMIIIVDLQ